MKKKQPQLAEMSKLMRTYWYIWIGLLLLVIIGLSIWIKISHTPQKAPAKIPAIQYHRDYATAPPPSSDAVVSQVQFGGEIFSVITTPSYDTDKSVAKDKEKILSIPVSVYNNNDTQNIIYNSNVMLLQDANGAQYSPVFVGRQPFLTGGGLFPHALVTGYLNYVVPASDANNYVLNIAAPGIHTVQHAIKIVF